MNKPPDDKKGPSGGRKEVGGGLMEDHRREGRGDGSKTGGKPVWEGCSFTSMAFSLEGNWR